jgi:hypothetical protein
MCRVLADLLNPRGAHCQGSRYLRLFWKMVSDKLGRISLDYENVQVSRERHTSDERFFDIVLEDGNIFVPVEVKIRARDQPKQIADYFAFAKTKNRNNHIPVLYLTVYGHEPSDISKAGLSRDDYVLLSFKNDILGWLEECARENILETTNPVREILRQLIAAIKSLCGKSEDAEMGKAIVSLIIQSADTIRAAVVINGNLQEFDNESKKLFKGSILDMVKKKLPKAYEYSDEGWHGIGVPLLRGQYVLFFHYDWKTIEIDRDDKADPATEEKLTAKMSEITRCDNERGPNIVWATFWFTMPTKTRTGIRSQSTSIFAK